MSAEELIEVRRIGGSWVAHIRNTAQFVTGWQDIAALRSRTGLRDHFLTDEYPGFVAEFGEPPAHE